MSKLILLSAEVLAALASSYLWARTLWGLRQGVWPLAPRPERRVPWNPLATVAVFYVGAALAPFFVFKLCGVEKEGSLLAIQAQCLWALLVLVVAPTVLALNAPTRWSDFGIHATGWPADLAAGAWGFVLSLLPVYLTELPVQSFRKPHPVMEALLKQPDATTISWVVLSAVIAAPLVEELLYRVLLQGVFMDRLGSGLGIVLAAVIFCAAHQWPDCIPLFPLALILGYVYHRRRSYPAVVFLHALFNGVNLLMALTQTVHPAATD